MDIKEFKSSYFSISQKLLSKPNDTYSLSDFRGHHFPHVVRFIKYLIGEGIMKRSPRYGVLSKTTLRDPEALLVLCSEHFKGNVKKTVYCNSGIPLNKVIKKVSEKSKDLLLGYLSGVRPELRYASNDVLTLQVLNRNTLRGYLFRELEHDIGFSAVRSAKSGIWNIEILLPKYWKFLKDTAVNHEGLMIPSDFYTYLSLLTSKNPLHNEAAQYIYNKIKGIAGNFLSWAN